MNSSESTYRNRRLCINSGWLCGLTTATCGSFSSKSERCSLASSMTEFITLYRLVVKSDTALRPCAAGFVWFPSIKKKWNRNEAKYHI